MSRRECGRAGEIIQRRQTPDDEWAVARKLAEILHSTRLSVVVEARTGGRCYFPNCDSRIISYPHALPFAEGGVHDAINRGGVCTLHSGAMHDGNDPEGKARVYLQQWLQRWYAEHEGMTLEEWWSRAVQPGAHRISDTG